MAELTPYDTGVRLEPKQWVHQGFGGIYYSGTGPATRLSSKDDFGKVDFDDDEDITRITVWADVDLGTGKLTIHVDRMDPEDGQPFEVQLDGEVLF